MEDLSEEDIKKESAIIMKEFDSAWAEYFKDKPEPKDDDEDKKQQEEFHYWYNYVRKQSDSGKTPAEMYKEIYGEEPPKSSLDATKPSRIMNFEWDEDYEEDFDEEDKKEMQKLTEAADYIFENGVWANSKEQMKDMSKRESSLHMFRLGFFMHYQYTNAQIKTYAKEMKDMPEEKINEIVKSLKEYSRNADREDENKQRANK
jgi:hypothetical protein